MSTRSERKTAPRRRAATGGLPRILPFDGRRRIAAVLEGCSRQERLVLALLLLERLTPPEAADALGVSARRLEKIYGGLMREFDASLADGSPRRQRRRRSTGAPALLRKAS